MKDWRSALVQPDTALKHAIEAIDAASTQIAIVVDQRCRLMGTVTDGDVRRALLRGQSLTTPIREVMNGNPTRVLSGQTRESTLELLQSRGLHQVPVVEPDGTVVGLEVLDHLLRAPDRENWVIIMAGGHGQRLRPLTEACPKPMLRIGDRPILEHIVESLVIHGYRNIFLSVNYLGHVIRDHFGDGTRWGARLQYIDESGPLGTAGALSLLPLKPHLPFIVMNGDLLTKVNFNRLLDFHELHGAVATMCIRTYEYQIPYGVVSVDGHDLKGIDEKPTKNCFVSAGIYAFAPEALQSVGAGEYLDMPALFQKLLADGKSTAAFPLREYWLDIGRFEDFERANGDFTRGFR